VASPTRAAAAFAGQAVLLTGASGGLGSALATQLQAAGARLTLVDRDGGRLAALQARLLAQGGAPPQAVTCDLSVPAARAALLAEIRSGRREVEVLILAAGATQVAPFAELDAAGYDRVFEVNFTSARDLVMAAWPGMTRRGRGRIVAVSSIAGLVSQPLTHAYVASKHALCGLLKGLQHEAPRLGIRLTLACPGYLDTPLLDLDPASGLPAGALRAELAARWLRPVPAQRAAGRLLDDAARGRFLSVFPLHARLYLLLWSVAPELALRLVGRLVDRYARLRAGGRP
jgi:short-subunit dehydrogenase